ncbi:hypothetical protein WJX72_010587 [[Myrmecia] bisecta]|uniref:Protein kinase domain-containing protein n=1 Tax=[Myrmecia] bisecta TaxID=41462 RepID=A0AAW1R947_9CHLO
MRNSNVTYRIYGQDMLHLTPQLEDKIKGVYPPIYAIADLAITVWPAPSTSVPVTYVKNLPATFAVDPPSPGANASMPTNASVPSFAAFDSVDIVIVSNWCANTTLPRIGGSIEDTYNQFHEQALARAGIKAKEITMQYEISRESSPIMSRIPIVTAMGSYTVVIQLVGRYVSPFTVQKQTLLMSVLRGLLINTAAVAWIAAAAGSVGIAVAMGLFVWRRRQKGVHSTRVFKKGNAHLIGHHEFGDMENPISDPDIKAVPLGDPTIPPLTEFQKAAARLGVWDFTGTLGDEDQSDGAGAKLQSAASGSGSEEHPASKLTRHRAGTFVHGWDIGTGNIEICRRPDGSEWVLGEGSFGMVYRAVRSGVQDVAVKVLTRADENQLRQFSKEISILKSLSFDRNIVQFYGACLQDSKPMLVLEYMEGGDLSQAMRSERGAEVQWYNKGQLIALDVARGLHFLHSNKVMHSDLKTGNILLTKDYSCAKIGDVGLARIMSSAYFTNAQLGGTFSYAAPELLLNARCSEKVDIYSFGVVLWEVVTGEQACRGRLRAVQVPEECPASVAQLIDDCLQVEAEGRPTAKQLFSRIRDAFADGPDGLMNAAAQQSVSSLATTPSIPQPDHGSALRPQGESSTGSVAYGSSGAACTLAVDPETAAGGPPAVAADPPPAAADSTPAAVGDSLDPTPGHNMQARQPTAATACPTAADGGPVTVAADPTTGDAGANMPVREPVSSAAGPRVRDKEPFAAPAAPCTMDGNNTTAAVHAVIAAFRTGAAPMGSPQAAQDPGHP